VTTSENGIETAHGIFNINNERGRHRIRLITENEEEAFDDLLSIVNFEVENNRYI